MQNVATPAANASVVAELRRRKATESEHCYARRQAFVAFALQREFRNAQLDALGPDELVALLNASEAFYYATVERVEYSGWLAQLLTAFRKTPPPARAR